jgi:hypothetical protein
MGGLSAASHVVSDASMHFRVNRGLAGGRRIGGVGERRPMASVDWGSGVGPGQHERDLAGQEMANYIHRGSGEPHHMAPFFDMYVLGMR